MISYWAIWGCCFSHNSLLCVSIHFNLKKASILSLFSFIRQVNDGCKITYDNHFQWKIIIHFAGAPPVKNSK